MATSAEWEQSIKVFPGRDPMILKAFQATELPSARADGICGRVRHVYADLLSRVPQDMADCSINTIPLYNRATHAHASNLNGPQDINLVCNSANQYVVQSTLPSEFHGFSLNLCNIDNAPNLDTIIGHECLHLITREGASGNMLTFHEAMTARLERDLYGDNRTEKYFRKQNLPLTSIASTGLSAPDYSGINYSSASSNAMYLSAYMALNAIRIEHVWNIWRTLIGGTRASGVFPEWRQVHEAMESHGERAGKVALTNPLFKMMTPGLHTIAFPSRNGKAGVFYNFSANQRQDFGAVVADKGVQEILFETENRSITVPAVALDRRNAELATFNMNLAPHHEITMEDVKLALISAGGQSMAKTLKKFQVVTKGGKVVIQS